MSRQDRTAHRDRGNHPDPTHRGSHPDHRDRGETLLELVIAIAVLGIGVTSVLGAVLLAVSASTLDQRQVQTQSRLRSWAESLQRAAYTSCAGRTAPAYQYAALAASSPLPALPSGFTASIARVQVWNPTVPFDPAAPGTFAETTDDTAPYTCPAGVSDGGVQRLDLQITASGSLYPDVTGHLVVTVDRP